MITAFYMIIAFLIYIFFTYIYIKKIVNQYINEELKIISGLKNKEKLDLKNAVIIYTPKKLLNKKMN